MKNKNDALDKVFEVLLTEAAEIANERIGENIILPEEEIEFSKEHEMKMQKLFKKEKKNIC